MLCHFLLAFIVSVGESPVIQIIVPREVVCLLCVCLAPFENFSLCIKFSAVCYGVAGHGFPWVYAVWVSMTLNLGLYFFTKLKGVSKQLHFHIIFPHCLLSSPLWGDSGTNGRPFGVISQLPQALLIFLQYLFLCLDWIHFINLSSCLLTSFFPICSWTHPLNLFQLLYF